MAAPGGFNNLTFYRVMEGSETVTLADGSNESSAVSLDVALTNVAVAAAEDATMTLPVGKFPLQIKRFIATSIGASGTITISGGYSAAGVATNMLFNANGEESAVMFDGSKWVILRSTATPA